MAMARRPAATRTVQPIRVGLACLLLWLFAACSAPPLYQQQSFVFGTLVEVTVYGVPPDQAREAVAEVLARFDELHRTLHAWQPSPLSALNATLARGEAAAVPAEFAAMLRESQTLSIQSDDLFNPAIGGLIALWGFQGDTSRQTIPADAAIAAWVSQEPTMGDLTIDGNTITTRNRAVRLDLGGYAKGRALDEAVALLKARGIRDALVNIGGNVIALGARGDRPWRVGVQHPRRAGTLAMLDLHDGEAIGTSGDYQRYFEVAGRRYSHLIDPRTGRPAPYMQAVTVLVRGPRAGVRSDAWSKPLFIDGPAELARHASRLGIEDYLGVDSKGNTHISPTMKARLR